ncbi:MAG TPA: hypothetical protein VJR47_06760 [Stellaceae bacterium]|nr:hypothetical protein [Stellaceae bacterium]
MGKLIRTNFDRHEMRRDRRYRAPAVTLCVDGADHPVRDWSLSGFRPACGMRVERGGRIAGALRIAASEATHPFTAEAVRGGAQGVTGFRFVECSWSLARALEKAVARRMAGRS